MPASQIYPVVNTIAKNLQGGNQTVVDPSGFAAFASNTINGSLEPVYSTIYNVIGRTLIAIDEAEEDEAEEAETEVVEEEVETEAVEDAETEAAETEEVTTEAETEAVTE